MTLFDSSKMKVSYVESGTGSGVLNRARGVLLREIDDMASTHPALARWAAESPANARAALRAVHGTETRTRPSSRPARRRRTTSQASSGGAHLRPPGLGAAPWRL